MLDQLLATLQNNIDTAPWIMGSLLLLAGFNIPVSEDAMLIISGSLAAAFPGHTMALFVGVHLGCYLSDVICYWFGRLVGPKVLRWRWMAKMVPPTKIALIQRYYNRYGIVTFIFGRFIPFGVRNALFMTAGLGKMHFAKFALTDWVACVISNTTLFSLTYFLGEAVIRSGLGRVNALIFAVAVLVVGIIIWRCKKQAVPPENDK